MITVMLLEKMLQSQGFGSRKHCQQVIKNGAVCINGEIIKDPKYRVSLDGLGFEVFQQAYQYREKVYIALNKPKGYECSHQPQHHQSVFSLFPEQLLERGLAAVGRLDQDTTGLLILTDDGQFLHALTHPKKHVPKTYCVTTADPIQPNQLLALTQGVELHREKGIFAATDVQQQGTHSLSLTIHQGVYHQVKRMLAAVGQHVLALHRQRIGGFELPPIKQGEWIYLEDVHIQALRRIDQV